jgi:hypothetical protein
MQNCRLSSLVNMRSVGSGFSRALPPVQATNVQF